MNNRRYDRQIVLPEIGAAGQEKLARASVLCIGAGGLGCPALLYLAAAGIGRIGVIDFDTVDESNLQRQVLFSTDQIGQNKAAAAKQRLNDLNPDIEIRAYAEELTALTAEKIFSNYDLIVDGSDNFATKFLINDTALKTGKPFIYGSILGFDGQLAVFNYNGGPCYRCLFPQAPKEGVANCAEAGVIGAGVGLIGAAQAMETIKIIAGHKDLQPLSGWLWAVNLRTMENRLLRLDKNPACICCSERLEKIVPSYASPPCRAIPEVTAQQAKANKAALLIDVREAEEWNAGHIEGARHIALSSLLQGRTPDLPDDCEIILYCQKGVRGRRAAEILQSCGHANITNMTGGYEAWLKSA